MYENLGGGVRSGAGGDPTGFYEALRADMGMTGAYPASAPQRLAAALEQRIVDVAAASAMSQGPLRIVIAYAPRQVLAGEELRGHSNKHKTT
jgi:hypothetical protein